MTAALTPGSPEWMRLVTASKVPAILGVSPWCSPRKMWHQMRGDIPGDPESRPMKRGNMLENAVLDWWLEENPEWIEVERQRQYVLDGEDWCAATPDMVVQHDVTRELMLVDAKTSGDDRAWREDVPTYYLASSLWQLAMAPNIQRVCLATLFGSPFDLTSFYVDRDDDMIDGLVTTCRAFYDSLTDDTAGPELSGMECEYEVMRALHPDIDRGERATIPTELAEEWGAAYRAEKALKGIKARVLDALGRAQYGYTPEGLKVARRDARGDSTALVYTGPKEPLTEMEEAS